jgi:TonB-linked SusC/RagA family outer membrane protein
MKLKCWLLSVLLLVSGFNILLAQQLQLKGKVTSKTTGAPLSGATVTVKGTNISAITDAEGNYTIHAPKKGSILVISYVGTADEERTVNEDGTINVQLDESKNILNDVVVVGYGTQRKSVTTGAISSIKAADLRNQQNLRLDQALQGRTSGVTVVQSSGAPGSTPQIRIRGITSRINSDPLYVINGIVVTNGGLDNVNPDDIESIEVLKDASAAIYGSRASNGVILVTTKKGRSGAPVSNFSTYWGVQGPVKKVKLANATEYATLRNEALTNDGKPAQFANPSSFGTGTNWQDEIFSNSALIQNHNMNFSGGTDRSTYYVSFGYMKQKGIVMPSISDYQRASFNLTTSFKVAKWFTVGENFSYAYTRSHNDFNSNSEFGGPLSSAINLDPITPVLAKDINSVPNPQDYTSPYIVRNDQGIPYAISPYVRNEMANPLAFVQTKRGNYNWAHNLLGSAYAEIEPVKGLKFRSTISAKQGLFGLESFTPLYYLNSSSSNTSNTVHNRQSNQNLTWNWDNTLSYSGSVQKHNFSVLAGTSAQQQSGMNLNGQYIGEPVVSFNQASFNYALANANKIAGGSDAQPYTVASVFGRVTYDYDQKYLLSGIIRRDGSSKFGTNNKYGTFPSVSLGWVVTREDFFPRNSFVDFLKIRGSYGVVGNEMALDPFQYTSIVASSGGSSYIFGPDQLNVGYNPNAPANPDLKWESTHSSNVGFEAIVFRNFNITFDLYKKLTKGMLQQIQLPAYGGFSQQPWANVGDMQNKGVELELGYRKKFGQLDFNASGNISYNKNEVLSLGTTKYFTVGTVQSSTYEIGRTAVGQQVGAFYGFQEMGVFHSQAEIDNYVDKSGNKIQPNAKPGDFKWADLNSDGKITPDDRKFLGDVIPHWTYGISIGANYKNFDFRLFGQGVWGNKIYSAYRRLDLNSANYPIAALNAWTPDNAASNYPRLTDADPNENFKKTSDFYLQSGAYFRIKTLQLGYTLPKQWISKAGIQHARIFISSNNLATITGYKGFDPEIQGGIDRGIYPQSRSFSIGADITL